MNTTLCRDCHQEVSLSAAFCPHCGAPHPYNQNWNGWGYEYQSSLQVWGLPLLHIAFGKDKQQKLRVAKGIIAIGQFAKGVFTIAQFGIGVFSITQFGVGVISISQFGIAGGLLAQMGIGLYVIAQFGIAGIWGWGHKVISLSDLF